MDVLLFLGSCVLIAMAPGVSTAVIMRQTMRSGRAAGLAATLGNETGVLLWALAAAFGLSALLAASQLAYDVMRVAGAVVLIWMGVQSLMAARRETPAEPAGQPGLPGPPGAPVAGVRRSYLLGLSTCLANPKAAVFALSFLPQFVPAGADVPATLVALAVVWVVVDTVWYGGFVWVVGRARQVLARPAVRRRLEQVCGAVLIGLGVRVALEAR